MGMITLRPTGIFQFIILLTFIIEQGFVSSYDKKFPRMGNFSSSYTRSLSGTSPAQYVQELVSNNCIVIFSKTTCPYCKMAKNLFTKIGAIYRVIELDQRDDGRVLQDVLAQMTGARTVPRVFVNGNFIGGGSDTKQLHEQGKLVPLIEQCTCSEEGSGNEQFLPAK